MTTLTLAVAVTHEPTPQASPQASPLPALRGNEPSATASRWFPLSPEAALEVVRRDSLVDTMGSWTVFPGVTGVEGPAGRWGTEVGKRRRINLADGTFVTETITEVLGDRGFRYTLTDFSNTFGKLAYGIYGEWIAEPLDGGTLLHWTWTYPAKPGLHFAPSS